jgi:hypothetical protein
MTPFSWFCLSLRIMGAWLIVEAFQYAVAGFDVVHGFDKALQYTIEVFLNQGVAHLVMGLLLIKLAPFFAALVYPGKVVHQHLVDEDQDPGVQ